MQCTGCGSGFSFFKKQHSCPVCGFIFCRKCCNSKAVVPSIHPQQKQSLCKKCFNRITSPAPVCPPSPPAAFKKRLEVTEAILNPKGSPKIPSRAERERAQGSQEREEKLVSPSEKIPVTKLGPTEKELRERLAKLKHVGPTQNSPNPVPSEQELSERLSKLKPVESRILPDTIPMLLPEKKTSEFEEAMNLVQQFQEEAVLDAKRIPPEKEIEERLKKFKEDWPLEEPPPLPPAPLPAATEEELLPDGILQDKSSDLEDSASDSSTEKTESQVQEIMQKFLKEAEEQAEVCDDSVPSHNICDMCAMCGSAATVECLNCDWDRYCSNCFKDWHKDDDSRTHNFVPVKSSDVMCE